MKKLFVLLIVLVSALAYAFFPNKKEDVVIIGVCKSVEHEALNSVVSGMEDYLKKQNKKYKILVETSQGNMALGSQIMAKFANSGVDVVVTVGTSPTQCGFKLAKAGKIKLVFASVTNQDDISPNLAGTNTTGVSNFVPLEPQVELFKKIQPSLKNLAIIYNFGEANSVSIVKRLRGVCKEAGINLIEQGISTITDISQALAKISADAIFISNDNLALSAMSNIVKNCNQKGIPVYVSDTDQVENGCVAALGPNQYDIGVQTGKMVQRIIDGENINDIKVEYPRVSELFLNEKSVKLLGMAFSDDLKAEAKTVFK
ncbi:hypothetical protein FACS1894122_11340 [Alphaproteobacteria bacterium]|nr:hypothetical protein FACS1894122_11340 [Alphaproteobacteria bacterium]